MRISAKRLLVHIVPSSVRSCGCYNHACHACIPGGRTGNQGQGCPSGQIDRSRRTSGAGSAMARATRPFTWVA